MNTVSDEVVRHLLAYLSVLRWFAGEGERGGGVHYYVNIWPQLTNPRQ